LPHLLVENEEALFHEADNPSDLADKIEQMWRDPELAKGLEEKAGLRVADNTWLSIVRRALTRLEESGLLSLGSQLPDENDPDVLRRRDRIRHDRRARKREWRKIREQMERDLLWVEHDRQRDVFMGQFGGKGVEGETSHVSSVFGEANSENGSDAEEDDEPSPSTEDGAVAVVPAVESASAGASVSEGEGDEDEESSPASSPQAMEYDDRAGLPFKPVAPIRPKLLRARPAGNRVTKAAFNLTLRALTWYARFLERRIRPVGVPEERPLRVLRLITSASVGGVAKVMNQTILQLAPKDVQTFVLIFGPKDHVSLRLLNSPGLAFKVKPMQLWVNAWDWRTFTNISRVVKILRRQKIDLVHVHEPQFAPVVRIAAAMAGVPMVVQLHSEYSGRRQFSDPYHKRLERQAMRCAALIGHAQNVIDDAYVYMGGETAPHNKKVYLTICGVDDVPLWAHEDHIHEWIRLQAGGKRIFLLIARLVPLKRVDDFIAACRMLMDSEEDVFMVLVVYGTGRVKNMQKTTRMFYSTFKPGDAELLYSLASPPDLLRHVYAAVSCSEIEGLPKSILEYMQHGVPVICSDIPAHRQLVEDEETGLLFEVGDFPSMMRQLRRILHDTDLHDRLVRNARGSITYRCWANTARQNLQIYRRVLTNGA
ncbi:glycosyltransferase, partial [bacterium]|nr:glycosyltransferase [bacterium]